MGTLSDERQGGPSSRGSAVAVFCHIQLLLVGYKQLWGTFSLTTSPSPLSRFFSFYLFLVSSKVMVFLRQ